MPAFPLIPLATAALGGAVLTDQIGKQFKKAGELHEKVTTLQERVKLEEEKERKNVVRHVR